MVLLKLTNESEIVEKLTSLLCLSSEFSIKTTGRFTIGLSGGSTIDYFIRAVSEIRTDWSKWLFFFCDERVVASDSPDSTYGEYKRKFFNTVPVSESQIMSIKQGASAEEAANDYTAKLERHFKGLPRFNILLLGMGPDGHTCSLFPGHPLLSEDKLPVAVITDSPKPPPERITLTMPVLNNAECCIFTVSGQQKAEMLKRILKDKEDLPAGRVLPHAGTVYWIVDEKAAGLL